MEQYTVEEFEADFDNLFRRVENGETFRINHNGKSVLIMPATDFQALRESICDI